MALTEKEKICPICGKDNNCQHGEGSCWCTEVEIPSHIFELVPDDKKDKVCICKDCIDRYTRNKS